MPMSPRLASAITSSPARARRGEHVLERGDSRRSRSRSKNATCGLTMPDATGGRLDHAQPELADAGGRVMRRPHCVEQRRVRVDADAQRPVRVEHGRASALAEGGHRAVTRSPARRSSGVLLQALHPKPSRSTSSARDGGAERGDRREQRLVGGDRRGADLVAVGARAARRSGVLIDHVDLAAR